MVHFSEAFSLFTAFPKRCQKCFIAFSLQHHPRRDLELCTWPSCCLGRWEWASYPVYLSRGLVGHHIPSPFSYQLSSHSSLIKHCITTSSLTNRIVLLNCSVSLSFRIRQLNPFGFLSVYSSWILIFFLLFFSTLDSCSAALLRISALFKPKK